MFNSILYMTIYVATIKVGSFRRIPVKFDTAGKKLKIISSI